MTTGCFFFNDTATTEIYTLPYTTLFRSQRTRHHVRSGLECHDQNQRSRGTQAEKRHGDRKSTRLNSSHLVISYAVFCLKKKSELGRARRQSTRHAQRHP